MGIPDSSISTQYRPSCRGIRSNCSKAPRKRRRRRPDLEQRRRDVIFGRLSPPEEGASTGRAMVVGPYLRRRPSRGLSARPAPGERSPGARPAGAVGLAGAIDLHVVEEGSAPLGEIRPATYLGKGKVDELAGLIKAQEIGIVVMDCALSPVQQRNLEKAFGAKVLDRTGP